MLELEGLLGLGQHVQAPAAHLAVRAEEQIKRNKKQERGASGDLTEGPFKFINIFQVIIKKNTMSIRQLYTFCSVYAPYGDQIVRVLGAYYARAVHRVSVRAGAQRRSLHGGSFVVSKN